MHNKSEKIIQGPDDIIGIYAQGKGDFGFVDVEGQEKGYYVFGRNSMNAMTGDKVLAKVKIFKGKSEATIKNIIERRKDPVVGVYQDAGKFGFLKPNNPEFKTDIFIPGRFSKDAKNDQLVAVEITKWEGKSPEGKVIKVLGKPGEKGVDILAIAIEAGARMGFGSAIQKELSHLPNTIGKGEHARRKDLRKLFTITIDGADSKDLDDAVSLEKHKNGNHILSVHIADVANYVKEGHAIDKEALRRGTSIYLVNKVIPMLPEELSNGLCSLNPNEDKLTLTAQMEINQKGHIVDTKVFESIIRSNYRMTYKEVDEINDGKAKDGGELLFKGTISKELVSMIQESEKLRGILASYKKYLGVLEFNFPETKIIVDDAGNPVEFKKYERYNSNKIIEEFMIVANEAVSRKFSDLPFLYRTHAKPSEEDIDKLYKSLAVFSYKVPILQDIKSKDIQKILDEVKNDSKEKLLSKMVLRSLTKAVYSPEREGHFGLALDYYSHFTSPIRRYPDLQIHRIMKEKIHKKLNTDRIQHYKIILDKVAKRTSDAEVKAEKLEYKIKDLMAVKYMKNKIGEIFDAHISGVIGKGVFVELENTIEGFVELNNEFGQMNFEFNEELMLIKNKITGKSLTIGDKITVVLKKVDEKLLRIDFAFSE